MPANISEIQDYIMALETVEFPTVQRKYSLSYSETAKIFAALIRDGQVSFISGFSYKVRKKRNYSRADLQELSRRFLDTELIEPASKLDAVNSGDKLLLDALWTCIISNNVSASNLQRRLEIGYSTAYRLIERLDELDLIDYGARKVLITAEEYVKKFGKR